jgi:hypothetical protein
MGGAYDFFDCRFVVDRGGSGCSILHMRDV